MSKLVFYKCEHCGNVAVKVFDQGPALVCCGEKMVQLEPDTVDASYEKHIPVVARTDDGMLHVQVGEELHPMIAEHWITMIVLETSRGFQLKNLAPGDEPVADFALAPDEVPNAVYAYCNIHGLWVTAL